MRVPLELTGLSKTFETPSGLLVVLKNVNLRVQKSEFVCILGHSGCGKSTLLSIVAGLQTATEGLESSSVLKNVASVLRTRAVHDPAAPSLVERKTACRPLI